VRLPTIDPAPEQVYPSKDFSAVLKRAQQDQKKRGDTYLGVDVLLLAMLGDGEISAAIAEAGLTKSSIEGALKDVRPEVSCQISGDLHLLCQGSSSWRWQGTTAVGWHGQLTWWG
jgi:ATP-dependent Clp protease ATP-binding subunit ClpA